MEGGKNGGVNFSTPSLHLIIKNLEGSVQAKVGGVWVDHKTFVSLQLV